MHNLFLAYDLITPGQNYDAVQNRIKQLGRWYKLQYSLYYVRSSMPIDKAYAFVRSAMDPNDKLTVIDARDAWIDRVPATDLSQIRAVFGEAALAA